MRSVVNRAEETMKDPENEERSVVPAQYRCDILLEKTTLEKVRDPSFPMDAYLIWYLDEGKEHIDLCRTQKISSLFDMYYDKYGPGSVQKIDFGYGRTNPKVWGYKQPEKKKKR